MRSRSSILVSKDPLSVDSCYQFVIDDTCGGLCFFVGTIRDHNKGKRVTFLEFDAYDSMAEKEMEKIASYCLEQFDINAIAIHHRKGHLRIRDIAVIIAVSAVHRDAAFKACRYAIDSLKANVPIWKKEYMSDGSYWVNAHP